MNSVIAMSGVETSGRLNHFDQKTNTVCLLVPLIC